jgi:site-specific recombinase XerD
MVKSGRAVQVATASDMRDLAQSFKRSLRAKNRAAETIKSYISTVEMFADFLSGRGLSTSIIGIGRKQVEDFMDDQLSRWKPKTARIRYGNLQQFFKWCVEEREIDESPMRSMTPPYVPEVPVPIISDDHLKRLFKTCQGTTFEQRRDLAILRVLYGCGLRRGELTGLHVDDVDWDLEVLIVLGKGRRSRSVPFGAKTSQALDRYVRERSKHALSSSPMLWLGEKGALGESGVAQMLRRRCKDAGIPQLHPHQFRHTAAHEWLRQDIGETNAMRLFGWKSRQMLGRYGTSAADERARDAFRRLAPGDRL